MFGIFVEFGGVRVFPSQHITAPVDQHDLHTQADAEVGRLVRPCPCRGLYHAVDPPLSKAAGNKDAVEPAARAVRPSPQYGIGIFRLLKP